VSFISLTVTVKHVVGGRNKQVLPQWKWNWCNIQFDNMGSVIFFECSLVSTCSILFHLVYIVFKFFLLDPSCSILFDLVPSCSILLNLVSSCSILFLLVQFCFISFYHVQSSFSFYCSSTVLCLLFIICSSCFCVSI
jgi:hypothetical protein